MGRLAAMANRVFFHYPLVGFFLDGILSVLAFMVGVFSNHYKFSLLLTTRDFSLSQYPVHQSRKMTRGNQRDLARAKNQKKLAEQNKKKATDGMTLEQRKFRDAELMREKQKKKEEEEAAAKATKS